MHWRKLEQNTQGSYLLFLTFPFDDDCSRSKKWRLNLADKPKFVPLIELKHHLECKPLKFASRE
jgi:hypothetical protein